LLGSAPDAPLERWPEIYGLYRAQDGAILAASEMPLIQALRGERTIHMEMFISNKASKDRNVEVSASPVRSVDGSAAFGAVMLLHDVTERRRGESMRRVELVRQREALVRQVHHNVKNSLAGIVALVQQHALEHPEMKELTENVEARLAAIAIVHGMQARDGSGIVFGSLVNSLKDNIRTLFGASMNMDAGEDGVWGLKLSESESVPLALALSELLVNACKHGNRRTLDFSAAREGGDLVIKIANNATQDIRSLGRGSEGGNGHGLGIDLVRSLLPRDKARLDYKQTGARVEAILRLAPAIFQPSA
jgi:two-component system, sensor histidine kinase PdtaS